MAISIVLCGNDAIESIVRDALRRHYPGGEWTLAAHTVPNMPHRHEPEFTAHPMMERVKERASHLVAKVSDATLALAFEHGTIRLAQVVDIHDLGLMDMNAEEIRALASSDEFKEKLRQRRKEAESQPNFSTISVATVVDRRGEVFQCSVSDLFPDPKMVSFFCNNLLCFLPEEVELDGRIPHPLQFVQAVADALLEYRDALSAAPAIKN